MFQSTDVSAIDIDIDTRKVTHSHYYTHDTIQYQNHPFHVIAIMDILQTVFSLVKGI